MSSGCAAAPDAPCILTHPGEPRGQAAVIPLYSFRFFFSSDLRKLSVKYLPRAIVLMAAVRKSSPRIHEPRSWSDTVKSIAPGRYCAIGSIKLRNRGALFASARSPVTVEASVGLR